MVNNKKTCSFEQLSVIKLLRVLDLQKCCEDNIGASYNSSTVTLLM